VELLHDVEAWRGYAEAQRARGASLALVPTMGALHAGHQSLFAAARRECDVVLATIFVNPRQFNDAGDLAAYPRTPEADWTLARAAGVDCLVEPTLAEMWPDFPAPTATTVSVAGLAQRFEGADRPGHFDGVASVVAKLFVITGRCRAYFGEKDFQQLAVIRRMARDLAFDVEVVGCPIVREHDGLAFSSRNARLSDQGRARALGLSRALRLVESAPDCASVQRRRLAEVMAEAGVATSYAEVVDPGSLEPSRDDEAGERRALVAGVVDGVRLIDNGPVTLVAKENHALGH
jgi:pantoate--beta-alanine ligase